MSAQATDGGLDGGPTDAATDAAKPDAAADASAADATLPDATLPPPSYFEDYTNALFPQTPCAANPDAGIRAGCFTSWLTLSDIDQDNDLDILFANGGAYYNVGPADPSAVYLNDGKGAFRDVTGPWFNNATSRLRQVAVADIDGDGDRDIYQPGGYGVDLDKLWVQKAPGVFENKASTLLPAELRSYAGAAHFGDLDGDGDVDLTVADWGKGAPTGSTPWSSASNDPGNVWIYMNDGTGRFTKAPNEVVPPPLLTAARTAANDGGVVGIIDGGVTLVKDGLWGRTPIDIDMADIDNDFDLDILVNMRNGQSRAFKNDGTGKFSDFTYAGTGVLNDAGVPVEAVYNYTTTTSDAGVTTTSGAFNWDAGIAPNYPVKRGPYVYNQELCDLDSDGDLDLLLDNSAARPAGQTARNFSQVAINVGNGRFEDRSRDYIFGEAGGDDNAVKCADVNGDGRYDLVVASLTVVGEKLLLFSDVDGGVFNSVNNAISPIRDPSLGIDMGDLDGDGLLDLVTGQGESSPDWLDRIYLGVRESKPDVTPPAFRAIEQVTPTVDQPIVIRMAVRDRVTSETGEHVRSVNLEYKVNGGATQTVKAAFIGGDLFRAVIPAQANGTTISITPVAVDRVGLRGTGPTVEYLIGTPVPDASVPEEDAAVDDAAVVGEADAAVEMMMDAAVATKPDASPITKADASAPKADAMAEEEEEEEEERGGGKKDDGCSVAANGQSSFSSALFAIVGLTLLALRNVRQRKRRAA